MTVQVTKTTVQLVFKLIRTYLYVCVENFNSLIFYVNLKTQLNIISSIDIDFVSKTVNRYTTVFKQQDILCRLIYVTYLRQFSIQKRYTTKQRFYNKLMLCY